MEYFMEGPECWALGCWLYYVLSSELMKDLKAYYMF